MVRLHLSRSDGEALLRQENKLEPVCPLGGSQSVSQSVSLRGSAQWSWILPITAGLSGSEERCGVATKGDDKQSHSGAGQLTARLQYNRWTIYIILYKVNRR